MDFARAGAPQTQDRPPVNRQVIDPSPAVGVACDGPAQRPILQSPALAGLSAVEDMSVGHAVQSPSGVRPPRLPEVQSDGPAVARPSLTQKNVGEADLPSGRSRHPGIAEPEIGCGNAALTQADQLTHPVASAAQCALRHSPGSGRTSPNPVICPTPTHPDQTEIAAGTASTFRSHAGTGDEARGRDRCRSHPGLPGSVVCGGSTC